MAWTGSLLRGYVHPDVNLLAYTRTAGCKGGHGAGGAAHSKHPAHADTGASSQLQEELAQR
eukprot:scaffold90847_cov20-Tisochrysis_lutea.AAC.1